MDHREHPATEETPQPLTAPVAMDWFEGILRGAAVQRSRKTFGDLRKLFVAGGEANLAPDTEVYNVTWMGTGTPGEEGALFLGCTQLHAGTVGGEFFMTHGHFHANRTRDELYLPVSGTGVLLRMDDARHCWSEEMRPGGVLSIRGAHAHRVVNTGKEPLVFWANWPADAGYDYGSIAQTGFALRVFDREGQPTFVPSEPPA